MRYSELKKMPPQKNLREPTDSFEGGENTFSIVRQQTRKVKNWKRNPRQISLWIAASLLHVEKKFCTVRGYKQIPLFIEEINKINLEK